MEVPVVSLYLMKLFLTLILLSHFILTYCGDTLTIVNHLGETLTKVVRRTSEILVLSQTEKN